MYIACFLFYNIFTERFNCWFSLETRQKVQDIETCWLFPNKWLMFVPIFIACLSVPAAGWMADAKFGNYKLFKLGMAFLFLYSTLNCLSLVFEALFWENNEVLFSWIHFSSFSSLLMIGSSMCVFTVLPLGLDQMPDGSASNITNFIAWFVLSLCFGSWVANASFFLKDSCLDETFKQNNTMIRAFVSTLCIRYSYSLKLSI